MILKWINKTFGFVLRAIDKVSKWTTIPADKVKHFLVGNISSSSMAPILIYNDKSVYWAIGAAVLIGAAKEIYDKMSEDGTPDWWDFIATSLGGIVAVVIIDLIW
jgi:hypothetical protein